MKTTTTIALIGAAGVGAYFLLRKRPTGSLQMPGSGPGINWSTAGAIPKPNAGTDQTAQQLAGAGALFSGIGNALGSVLGAMGLGKGAGGLGGGTTVTNSSGGSAWGGGFGFATIPDYQLTSPSLGTGWNSDGNGWGQNPMQSSDPFGLGQLELDPNL